MIIQFYLVSESRNYHGDHWYFVNLSFGSFITAKQTAKPNQSLRGKSNSCPKCERCVLKDRDHYITLPNAEKLDRPHRISQGSVCLPVNFAASPRWFIRFQRPILAGFGEGMSQGFQYLPLGRLCRHSVAFLSQSGKLTPSAMIDYYLLWCNVGHNSLSSIQI